MCFHLEKVQFSPRAACADEEVFGEEEALPFPFLL